MMRRSLAMTALAAALATAAQDTAVVEFSSAKNTAPSKAPEYFLGFGHALQLDNPKTEPPETFAARVELLRGIKAAIQRGPSGTEGNFFLWREGHLNKDAAAHADKGPDASPVTPQYIYREAVALDIPYVFNTNVSSQSPQDIADLVKEIKKISAKTIFLEMGNELFEPGCSKTFPACGDYIAKVRAVRAAVHAVDPTVKIGVVCPAYAFSESRYLSSGLRALAKTGHQAIRRYLDWDKTLAANQDAFDAVILHPYIFFSVENVTQDSLMAYMFAKSAAQNERLLVDDTTRFPGKKIWVTEFGPLCWRQFGEPDKKLRDRIQMMKTPGMALVNMETYLNFLAAGNVELTTISFVDGQGLGAVSPAANGYAKLPNYYILEELSQLLATSPFIHRLETANCPSTEMIVSFPHVSPGSESALIKFPNFGAWGFGDAKTLRQVALINRTPHPGKAGLAGKKLKRTWRYGGRQALPEFLNYSRDWTLPPAVNPEPDRTAGDVAAQLDLPPYSMTIAEVVE